MNWSKLYNLLVIGLLVFGLCITCSFTFLDFCVVIVVVEDIQHIDYYLDSTYWIFVENVFGSTSIGTSHIVSAALHMDSDELVFWPFSMVLSFCQSLGCGCFLFEFCVRMTLSFLVYLFEYSSLFVGLVWFFNLS